MLVAKCISELQYEECLVPEGGADCWTLNLASGARYRFFAWQSLWGQLRLNAESLMRNGKPVDSAAQFFIDAQGELGMDDIVLANLLEECATPPPNGPIQIRFPVLGFVFWRTKKLVCRSTLKSLALSN